MAGRGSFVVEDRVPQVDEGITRDRRSVACMRCYTYTAVCEAFVGESDRQGAMSAEATCWCNPIAGRGEHLFTQCVEMTGDGVRFAESREAAEVCVRSFACVSTLRREQMRVLSRLFFAVGVARRHCRVVLEVHVVCRGHVSDGRQGPR